MKKFLCSALALLMVACLAFSVVGCKKPSYTDDGKTYSYRMGPSDIPENWNIHTYTSNASTYVLDYTEDSLYTFDYNADFTGYVIVPSMAKDYPVDVTSQFVGKWGVEEGDEDKIYKITLKDNLTYDNGVKITAQDFVTSMKWLLNPQAANFRADSFYASGDLKIQGAEAYVKQGSESFEDLTGGDGLIAYEGYNWEVADEHEDVLAGIRAAAAEAFADSIFLKLNDSYVGSWIKGNYSDYLAAWGVDCYGFLVKGYGVSDTSALDGKTLAEIAADDELIELYAELLEFWCTDPGEQFGFFCSHNVWEAKDFDSVGFWADGNDLYIALKNPMDDNFYLRYELCTSFFLVYNPLYEQCAKVQDGVYTSTYGTSIDTYVGFGPYKLTTYQEGALIVLERNPLWHGYQAGEYVENTWMCDRVVYYKVTENSTRLEMFLKGELDSYGLQAEDMDDYYSSKYTYFTDSESTWYLAMNPDFTNLYNKQQVATPVTPGNVVNKTVLSIDEFNKALSYSLNRTDYNKALVPTCGVAVAYLSSAIIADPDTGMTYRSTDAAKDAILNFWGLADQWGEGKEYATRDEAIASITGYNPALAKTFFDKAYDIAVEKEYITAEMIENGNWEVQINIGLPSSSNTYTKGYEYLSANWTKAVEGTKFEGHVSFISTGNLPSSGWGEYLRNGSLDLFFFVGYSGSKFNPYSMLECLTGSLQYDKFTNYDDAKFNLDVKVKINGEEKTLRATIYDWLSNALQGNEADFDVIGADGNPTGETITTAFGTTTPSEDRIAILAACESYLMTVAHVFPTSTDASASLRCMRYIYKTEEYVLGMGFGGIKYSTFAMDDTEWFNYVQNQGGVLNYKVEE